MCDTILWSYHYHAFPYKPHNFQNICEEDLGFLTESVLQMLKESGFPGMKVLQFAFDSREESDYMPHNYN